MDSDETEPNRWHRLWQFKGTVLGLVAVSLALIAGITQAPTQSPVYMGQVWQLEDWYSFAGFFGVLTIFLLALEYREQQAEPVS